VRKYTQLLSGVRLYVAKNINKRLEIISQAWEVGTILQNLSQRITSFTEYLKKYLEHDEGFYNNEVKTFIARVTSLSDHHINQQQFPSNKRIKQIREGWEARVNMLKDTIVDCERINEKRGDAFLKALDIVRELQGPQILRNFGIITKEQLDKDLVVVKTSWADEFDSLVEFPEEELKCWLVTFVNENEDHLSTIDQLHVEFKEIEEDIFMLRVKKEITIPLIKEYINEWLKKLLQEINNPE
jgi:hypothetical protein